ncbi:MAG: hypothetical protein QOF55_2240 [Thermoleophilaceae bacterium]|jgi:hypothetical protein|nr:hypothetical protein [Thermoleophilaceae bacterium]
MIAAGAGAVLIISLFLEWYNVSAKNSIVAFSIGGTGWEVLGFIDILLFLIGAIAIGLAVAKAAGVMPRSLPATPGLITLALGAFATLLVLYRLISVPDAGAASSLVDVSRSFGIFVALIGAAGVALGGWLSWNEEGKPRPGAGAVGGSPGVGAGGPPAGAPLGAGQPFGGQPQAQQPPQQQAYAQPAAAATPAAATPAQAPAAAAAKADWYPDPRGEKRLRYWDGSQWTDHTAD